MQRKNTGTQQAHRAILEKMSKGQYIAMCLIGGVAIVAYLQGWRLEQAVRRITSPGGYTRPGQIAI